MDYIKMGQQYIITLAVLVGLRATGSNSKSAVNGSFLAVLLSTSHSCMLGKRTEIEIGQQFFLSLFFLLLTEL